MYAYYFSWVISGPSAPSRVMYRECSSAASLALRFAFFSYTKPCLSVSP